ncbi:hypothetical protein FOZ61_009387 [Perkinsus olseni]|nr:hypothetical protein FOZ61_009387 [Perkinsus olseni]
MMSVRSKEWSVMDDLWRTSSMLNRRERRPGVNMDVDTLRVENMTWRMRNKWKNHVPSEIDYEDDASPDSAGIDESCKGLLDVIKDHNEDIEVETSRILAGAPFASTSLSSVFRHDHYHGFLLDMDGVLHQFGKAIPGASEFMTTLNAGQVPYMLLTNECRYTTEELSRNLLSILGVSIPANQIYTAANSAADFFCRLMANGWTGVVYIVGEIGLVSTVRQAFVKHGLPEDSVVTGDTRRSRSPKEIDYVLIGSVHSDNTRYVEYACSCVQEGARLLFTCPDYYEVTSDGSYKFGMPMPAVETISKVTHASSYNLGKPNPHMLRMARQRLLSQYSRGRTPGLGPVLFVGDSLGTDIRTAIENGIDCALVMSGCTDEQQLKRSPLLPNFVPNFALFICAVYPPSGFCAGSKEDGLGGGEEMEAIAQRQHATTRDSAVQEIQAGRGDCVVPERTKNGQVGPTAAQGSAPGKSRSTHDLPRLEELIEKAMEDAGPSPTHETTSTPISESSRSPSVVSEDFHEIRACAPVLTDYDLEDQEASKMRIFVHSEHGRHAVGWFTDISSPADIRECIFAAVDSIVDDGAKVFKLRSRKSGTIIGLDSDEDLPKLTKGEHYDLLVGDRLASLGHDNDDAANDSRWRRLRVSIDPMKHMETTKALERYSAGQDRKESIMSLADVCELRLGQQTPTFLKYRLPMLQHLSFSLIYKPSGSEKVTALDLTCKDEFEYDIWLTGLKALLCAQRNSTISKEQLLAHSRRFRDALEKQKVRVKLLEMDEVKERGTVGLYDCVKVSESASPKQLRAKLERLRDRLKHVRAALNRVLENRGDEEAVRDQDGSAPLTGVEWTISSAAEPAYSSLLSDVTDVEDEEMEASRAVELTDGVLLSSFARGARVPKPQVSYILDRVSSDLLTLEGDRGTRLRGLDQSLWKAEVDIENVEDMRQRLLEARDRDSGALFGVLPAPLVADMRSSLDVIGNQAEETLFSGVEALKELFGKGKLEERVQLPPGP